MSGLVLPCGLPLGQGRNTRQAARSFDRSSLPFVTSIQSFFPAIAHGFGSRQQPRRGFCNLPFVISSFISFLSLAQQAHATFQHPFYDPR